MTAHSPTGPVARIRAVLAVAPHWMTAAAILHHDETLATTTSVAAILFQECRAGRVERCGDRGTYSYRLTTSGHAAAADPRELRSRFHRRTHNRRTPNAAVLNDAIEDAGHAA